MKRAFFVLFGLLAITSASAKPKGQYSFGLSVDKTWTTYDYPEKHFLNGSSTGTSSGLQFTMGGFYRQDWWLIGIAGGAGTENFYSINNYRQHFLSSSTRSFITEATAAAYIHDAGRALFLTAGIIPSIHIPLEENETMQPFVISPFVGIALAPARHFAAEARLGYDPVFRQARVGMSFRF